MSFQKCPKCDGCGTVASWRFTPEICFVCRGFGVIDEQTGEPLYKTVTTTGTIMPNAAAD